MVGNIAELKKETRVNYLAFSSGNVCCFMAVNVLSLMNKMLARQKANTLELFWMMKAKTEERMKGMKEQGKARIKGRRKVLSTKVPNFLIHLWILFSLFAIIHSHEHTISI